ncbi:hypothetical protein RBH94_12025 [Aestuariibaculum sp. YM273]|uniref:hypothetical protein n=1 Tax=Aestuariibaculum sp. YM273 TaxID=3070659 RepID=UPI0027DD26AE|nr:hypothetical protein [Aestuariibaculum sp. YM273]WMI64786.1 hypothetical protein RBH94_12025 [Aestuariibaculum sp. YM273]
MDKKHTEKNSAPSVNLRLPQELKDTIQTEAAKKNLTVSKYLRELLENIYSGDYCKKEVVGEKVETFLFSQDFMQLIVWMYTKKADKKKTESNEELNRYISTLKKVEGHMPDNLVREFDKILQDIIKVRNDENKYLPPSYTFIDAYSEKEKFNFNLLQEFLLNDDALSRYVFLKSYKPKFSTFKL